jgi:predicted nucleic acid-binding protein
MRPVLLDSSVLIDVLRGRPEAVAYLDRTRAATALVSVTPVRTEVLGGIRSDGVRVTLDLLREIHWLDVTIDLADVAAGLSRRFRPAHSGVGVVDYLVAAGSIHIDAGLATMNIRHFPMFPGLERPY